jgi:cytochrome d ubiquinol oxidase subunit I
VTFAVGAVTGAVLTFECGLLWPTFMGQFSAAFGVPIVIAGIGGSISVVAANSWMNEPSGFTLDSAGKVVSVDPIDVIFNKKSLLPGEGAEST